MNMLRNVVGSGLIALALSASGNTLDAQVGTNAEKYLSVPVKEELKERQNESMDEFMNSGMGLIYTLLLVAGAGVGFYVLQNYLKDNYSIKNDKSERSKWTI